MHSIIIGSGLRAWSDTNLRDVQCRCRPNRGCNDAIRLELHPYEEAIRRRFNLNACFVDLSNAYESIDGGSAWNVLELRGVPS